MHDHQLRSILLCLQHRLSDNDRERLHFYLKNDVPRPVGDDSTLGGTLRLMQSLFDQEKISENDCTLLIDAFKQIRCTDAVNLLREHQRRMKLNDCSQSTLSLTSIMRPPVDGFFNDYDDDKCCTVEGILNEINALDNQNDKNHSIDNNNININPTGINKDKHSLLSSRKQGFWKVSFTKKCFFLSLIPFLLTLGIFSVVVIQGKKHIGGLEAYLQAKQAFIIELEQKRKTDLIKVGRSFGGPGGGDFDDSLPSMCTTAHYLSGVIYSSLDDLNSCQFIYTSSHDNQSRIESKPHGDYRAKINSTYQYYLDDDDRIAEVTVKSADRNFFYSKKSGFTTKVVIGLKFRTIKGRIIPPDANYMDSDIESERIPGYILGYATGRNGLRIDQLQFFWYRTKK